MIDVTAPRMSKTILLIGTLDTKAPEYTYARDSILARGHEVLLVDAGVLGDPVIEPDITAKELVGPGHGSLQELRERRDRDFALNVMTEELRRLVPELHARGRFDGVLGIGGAWATTLVTAAMRSLPIGVPNLMVSTLGSGDTTPFVGGKSIALMHVVARFSGLNRFSRRLLANAVGAICGMVEQRPTDAEDRPLVAATMFGVTTPCVTAVRERLERAGYEVLVFHVTGTGGRTMEALIENDCFAGVVDVTTTEWCDEVVGGLRSAGPDRLGAAARVGIPQVVSVGALDMVNFGRPETVPVIFRDRNLYQHSPHVTLLRTSAAECSEIGRRIAEKLNQARGPTVLMLPLRGVSAIDAEGEPFYDREADRALFASLRAHVSSQVSVVEIDAHINDPDFAAAVASRFLTLMSRPSVDRPTAAARGSIAHISSSGGQ